jgi:outer membrane protein OmpA-like peptidoglycan-associated protein
VGSSTTSRLGTWLGIACAVACGGSHVLAQDALAAMHLRTSGAGALMLSKDQRTWLQYDRPGVLADIQLAYSARPWLDVQFGATGGVFLSHAPGGLVAPVVGVLTRLPLRAVTPYALLDLGVGFTGAILRPFARSAIGLDFALTRHMSVGPNVGLGVVSQWDKPGYSGAALFAWFGLSCSYVPTAMPPAARDPLLVLREHPQPSAAQEQGESPEPSVPPAASEPVAPPSAQLVALLERAVPTARSELLAPVLFALDSAELEPMAIAMLHEVARVLCTTRSDIELLEIVAYADARGAVLHNRELSRLRAHSVMAWLIEHGVARERLQLSAAGSVDFVEPGQAEADHQQNRRVVFRVLRARDKHD